MSIFQETETRSTPRCVSVREAGRLLGLGLTSTWGLIAEHRLRTIKIGRRTLVLVSSVDALVASLSHGAEHE